MSNKLEKFVKLQEKLKSCGKLMVMFSGGLDSTVLLKVAHDVMGDRAAAVTIKSPIINKNEIDDALKTAALMGVVPTVVEMNELENPGFRLNPPNRCYVCRKMRNAAVKKLAADGGFQLIADGLNSSDLSDYRPGLQASSEDGIWNPFIEFDIHKEEIRQFAKKIGIKSWDRPNTVCLCSRFPYGMELKTEDLRMVEKAEEYLSSLGLKKIRVRFFPYKCAVIETGDLGPVIKNKDAIIREFKKCGFLFVTMDMEGFQSGKLNRVLERRLSPDAGHD